MPNSQFSREFFSRIYMLIAFLSLAEHEGISWQP